jgi:hypothetical protein
LKFISRWPRNDVKELTHLADIIHRHGYANKRADCDENLTHSKNNPVKLVLQCRTNKSKADRHQNKVGKPQRVKAELWFPYATIAGSEPERNSIAEKLPVQKPYHNPNPMHKSD